MTKEYHYIKEILEQPEKIRKTLLETDAHVKEIAQKYCGKVDRILMTGCGDPYMLGIGAVYAFEQWAGIPAESIEAAETSLYRSDLINERTLVILISSSGKTIKTIDSAKFAIERNAPHFGLVNLAPSSLTEVTKDYIQTQAGWSDSFSTKQTTTAQAVLLSLALYWAEFSGKMKKERVAQLRHELYEGVPEMVSECFKLDGAMKDLANKFLAAPIYSFIGSGPNISTAMLSTAKMIETSQSRAWFSNLEEFAHLFQISQQPGDPVFIFHNTGPSAVSSLNLSEQISACGGYPIIVGPVSEKEKFSKKCIYCAVPNHDEIFDPIVSWIPVQLFSYYVSIGKERNPDKPINHSEIEMKYSIYTSPLEGWDKR